MYCSKCGKENPDDAQFCSSCSSALTSTPMQGPAVSVKTSGMAIAAMVLGILSFFSLGLTAIPALIFGIISLVIIEKSGGRITGRGFAITGIVTPVLGLPLLMGILMPALARTRQITFRMVCGTNLSGIGNAMNVYSNDYDGEYPRAGGRAGKWGSHLGGGPQGWLADNRFAAYGLQGDGSGGMATVSSSLYLLVKYADLTPRSFVCKGDSGTTEFKSVDYNTGNRDIVEFWDFGPFGTEHCSYSYHMPYGQYSLTTLSELGMAVAADRNPWMKSPGAEAKGQNLIRAYNPDGGREYTNIGNAIAHQEDGQNVLFVDGHVAFEKVAFCGINDDNIYTFDLQDGDPRRGGYPIANASEPAHKLDSVLVNDGEGGKVAPRGRE